MTTVLHIGKEVKIGGTFLRYLAVLLLATTMSGPLAAGPPKPAPPAPPPSPAAAKVDGLFQQFGQLYRAGQYAEAEKVAARCVALAEKTLGRDADRTSSCLNNLAAAYFSQRNYTAAVTTAERAMAIIARTVGKQHPRYGLALSNRAHLLMVMGKPAEAVVSAQQSVVVVEKAKGGEHPLLSTMLDALGQALVKAGRASEAKPHFQRALSIRQKSLGPDTLEVAEILHRLADLAWDAGDLRQARKRYAQALQIEEKKLPADHRALINSLSALGALDERLGDHASAAQHYRRAITISKKTAGASHPRTAELEGSLGAVLLSSGDYRQARQHLERAERVLLRQLARGSVGLTQVRMNGAMARHYLGQYEAADTILREVLADAEAVPLAPASIALVLSNMGQNLLSWGRYGAAQAPLARALALRRKHLKDNDPALGHSLLSLSAALSAPLSALGDYGRANALLEEAVAHWTRTLGGDHDLVAVALNNQARLSEQQRHFTDARKLYDRALGIVDKRGMGHAPAASAMLENRAIVLARQGDVAAALADLRRANGNRRAMVDSLIGLGSEKDKSALVTAQAVRPGYALGLHFDIAPDHRAAAEFALTTVLRRKGRVLDAVSLGLSALRQHLTAEQRKRLGELSKTRAKLAAGLFSNRGISAEEKRRLERRAGELEAQLSEQSEPFRVAQRTVTIADVQRRLPAATALVEYVRYDHFDGQAKEPWGKPHYAAYVIIKGQPIQWVALGPAEIIEQELDDLRRVLGSEHLGRVQRAAQSLDGRLLRPLQPLLKSTERLLISPAGALNLLPFEALVDEAGRYRVQTRAISYLSSGRDLLRLSMRAASRGPAVVLADPDYDAGKPPTSPTTDHRGGGDGSGDKDGSDEDGGGAQRGAGSRQSVKLRFSRLPGTAAEAASVGELIEGARLLTGAAADKAALRKLHGPVILHLATHGFFLSSGTSTGADGARGFELVDERKSRLPNIANPLLRSGLALSGANRRSGGNQGVLSALEASGLDLLGTRLVVLSACETGVGEVRQDEGVYGLRRAFVIAGAEALVMSLWKVNDEATRTLMVRYYQNLKKGQGRREALQGAQLSMLENAETAHPHYWAGFILSGAWTPLDEGKHPVEVPKVKPTTRGCACEVAAGRPSSMAPFGAIIMILILCMRWRRRSVLEWNGGRPRSRSGSRPRSGNSIGTSTSIGKLDLDRSPRATQTERQRHA